ncbi:MAG TPA: transposase, partial [Hanamia sp.]|nr:transposase [Hanamia sp.]
IEFTKKFQSDADCITYLMDIKWKDGVKCKKCGSNEFWKGKCSNNMRTVLLRKINNSSAIVIFIIK